MRSTIVAGAVLALTLLTAAPAQAAPEISERTCEATYHGTFTRAQGVKTCTWTYRASYGGPRIEKSGGLVVVDSTYSYEYVGLRYSVVVTGTTVTQTQKGNGPVTTTWGTEQVLDEYVAPYDCLRREYTNGVHTDDVSIDFAECQSLGLFTA